MRLVILTSTANRHKYFANELGRRIKDVLVISEKKSDDLQKKASNSPLIEEHLAKRNEAETLFFTGHDEFLNPTLTIANGQLNSEEVFSNVSNFNPNLILVYGSSIIKDPLLSLMPYGRMLNLHLGMSPYYRGSGTNFWPWVNDELQFVGATILNIDAGVDTGNIIAHVRPSFEKNDTVHTTGCKVIIESVLKIQELIEKLDSEEQMPGVPQWKSEINRYYRKKDFTEDSLKEYYKNLNLGIVAKFLEQGSNEPENFI